MEEAFQSLNLIFCELASLLMLGDSSGQESHSYTGTDVGRAKSKHVPGRSDRTVPVHIRRVQDYVVGLLRGESTVSSGVQPTLSRPISPTAYIALLPTIWALINSEGTDALDSEESILSAVIEHAIKVSSGSAIKRHTIEFVGRLILVRRSHMLQSSSSCHWVATRRDFRPWA